MAPSERVSCTSSAAALACRLADDYRLPVSASLFLRLTELGKSDDASPADYAEVISASNSLSTRILSTVNAAWFGVRYRVHKVTQAVVLLGSAKTRALAIAHCLAAVNEKVTLPAETMDSYWRGSLFKAAAGRVFVEQMAPELADEAFFLCLMQDIAMPLMHEVYPDLYVQAVCQQEVGAQALCRMEREAFGIDHGGVALSVAEKAGIPPSLCAGLSSHHDRAALADACDNRALADAQYFAGLFPHMPAYWTDAEKAAAIGMVAQRLAGAVASFGDLLERIQDQFCRLVELVCPAGAGDVDLPDLLRRASGELADCTTGFVAEVHTLTRGGRPVEDDERGNTVQVRGDPALVDTLTGVLNRHGLEQAGSAALQGSRQSGSSVAVLFADIDDFKAVNDRFVHATGDLVLRHVAASLKSSFGLTSVVGRYGGDEFVIVVGGLLDRSRFEAVAREALVDLGDNPPHAEGETLRVGLSMGAVWCAVAPARATLDELIEAADRVMYAVKNSTKGKVRIEAIVPGGPYDEDIA